MLLGAVAFLFVSLFKLEPPLTASYREIKNLDQKISEAKDSLSKANQLSAYFSSYAYLERQARLKLNYKKPDENVVYVYKRNIASASAESKINGDLSKDKTLKNIGADFKNWIVNLFK